MIAVPTLKILLASVRVYSDADAFRRDEFGRREHLEMKPLHDELYQMAISLKLATALVVMQRRRQSSVLQATFTLARKRPRWHPANPSPSKNDLLIAPVTAFARSWVGLRLSVEKSPKDFSLWHDDPALVFEPVPGVFMCRTACVGHEGEVLYFAYRKEREWQAALERYAIPLIGEGDGSYRKRIPTPGKFAE